MKRPTINLSVDDATFGAPIPYGETRWEETRPGGGCLSLHVDDWLLAQIVRERHRLGLTAPHTLYLPTHSRQGATP